MKRVSLINSWAIARGARQLAQRGARFHRVVQTCIPQLTKPNKLDGTEILTLRGKLYFATRITRKTPKGELMRTTAVPASFVHEIMSNSPSRRQVVLLGCCFSGAFAEGMSAMENF